MSLMFNNATNKSNVVTAENIQLWLVKYKTNGVDIGLPELLCYRSLSHLL
ncbi:MAG: hypothetical protein ACJASI_001153, partial [Glaciecola sp.]